MRNLETIRGILLDHLSYSTYCEVSEDLIVELSNCNSDYAWSVLNDYLSNCAIDELEYETKGLADLKKYLRNNEF